MDSSLARVAPVLVRPVTGFLLDTSSANLQVPVYANKGVSSVPWVAGYGGEAVKEVIVNCGFEQMDLQTLGVFRLTVPLVLPTRWFPRQ